MINSKTSTLLITNVITYHTFSFCKCSLCQILRWWNHFLLPRTAHFHDKQHHRYQYIVSHLNRPSWRNPTCRVGCRHCVYQSLYFLSARSHLKHKYMTCWAVYLKVKYWINKFFMGLNDGLDRRVTLTRDSSFCKWSIDRN